MTHATEQSDNHNYLGLRGIEFTEFASPDSDYMEKVFAAFGFSKLKKFKGKDIYYYNQNDIHFLINQERMGFSHEFAKSHGPAISSMGWRVDDAEKALSIAIDRGATAAKPEDTDLPYPAIYGIGNSLIYFIDTFAGSESPSQTKPGSIYEQDFEDLESPVVVENKGFLRIDHLTNNVYKGTMQKWADFYKDVFGFTEVRYFDIKGQETALLSYALRSPDGSFCIPINEGKGDDRNQIDEYLREYNGPGVQHIAFETNDILESLDKLDHSVIDTLDIHEDYYKTVFDRVPNVREDHQRIQDHQVLVDGDENSYLLQIFTKNLFGPIFIEIIQRANNLGFGEGNFQALFESIERDQKKRGVLKLRAEELIMKIEQIHHVAYRCKDAKETVEFYTKVLNMDFILAIAEDRVPSTKEPDPYMHLFMDAGNGNILAFFELPNSPEMGKDPNTPEWVQHIALRVKDEDALMEAKKEIEAHGIEVIGPTNHEIIKSIYFFDPNGHRLELTCVTATDEMMQNLDEVKWDMLDEWSRTKKAPKHAEWLHSEEFVEV